MTRKLNRVRSRRAKRRGAIIVQVVVTATTLMAFAALAVDVGQIFSVHADLQRAADAAALAGASGYFTPEGRSQNLVALTETISERSEHTSSLNESYRAGGTALEPGDVNLGTHDFDDPKAPLDTTGSARFNAVEVKARREAETTNGAVLFFFARVFGMGQGDVTASATAAVDDRAAGYNYEDGSGPGMLPFTIHIDIYNEQLVSGADEWSFEDDVVDDGDGIPEIKLFPYKQSGSGNNNVGAGNFGILEFGGSGTNQVVDNIDNGIDPDDMEDVMGTSSPMYVNEDGGPITYNTIGEPGMKAGLSNAVEERIGDIVAFFVHDQVSGSGSNAVYRNVGIRIGRIMHIDLTGSPNHKELVIQPVPFSGPQVIVREYAESSNYYMGRIMLVK